MIVDANDVRITDFEGPDEAAFVVAAVNVLLKIVSSTANQSFRDYVEAVDEAEEALDAAGRRRGEGS